MICSQASALIEAVERSIFSSFGIPKFLRSDEEPGLFTSREFFEYLKPLGVKYLPTSVGSPWANSHAERSIRTIKEAARTFLQQERIVDKWDKHLLFFHEAHNNSTSVYGYAPHQLMFAYNKPTPSDLLQFWPNVRDQSDYMEKIVPYAEKIREVSQMRADKAKGKNRTYKNQSRVKKKFQLGDLVAHKQLQLATGSAMGMKPRHNGPYVIVAFDDDGISATIEHLHSGIQMKAHFSNMSLVNFHPKSNRVQAEFDNDLLDMIDLIDHKSTLYPKTRRPTNIPIDHLDDSSIDSVRATFVEDTEAQTENSTEDATFVDQNDDEANLSQNFERDVPQAANRFTNDLDSDNEIEQINETAKRRRKQMKKNEPNYNPWTDSESESEEETGPKFTRPPTPYYAPHSEPDLDPDLEPEFDPDANPDPPLDPNDPDFDPAD